MSYHVPDSRIDAALSSHHWRFFLHDFSAAISLREFLGNALPHIPSDSWDLRFSIGGVFVNGLLVSRDTFLTSPTKIEYYEPKWDITTPHLFFPQWSNDWIVFEDEWFIVCYKPHRLPTLPVKEQTSWNLRAYLETYVGNSVHVPSRLDTSTKGLVIISKNVTSHSKLQQIFEQRSISKSYIFHTSAIPTFQSLSLSAPIGPDRRHPILRCLTEKSSKEALTHFSVINTSNGTLIKATPITGRTHQIRLHAASLGLPITGDNFYGGAVSSELHLVCYSLEFIHPITGHTIHIELPQSLRPNWLFLPARV